MVLYNFKSIAVVPSAKDFIDIVLSKTQRKTPTVIHNGYAISRIRKFYMRKVKFTQENFGEKLNQILSEYPRLDDIHPFYADLINVLYSRDHYKLALGQLNTAKSLVDNIGKDYLKLLKFADSLYRAKELKRAALGRMCTLMKKLTPSLSYLEQVRQHLSRLPSIDPSTRTLLVTGYPNTGKSSFVNTVTNANVEVQPYAFTTKSLFVGHTDYQYVRWQVIDSPGILDHPLEDRNTIEMQAITALAHLHATILFFIDPSEQCGYSLKQQCALFHSIKALFANKPLLVVCNKTDLKRVEDLDEADRQMVEELVKDRPTAKRMSMSNMTTEGVNQVMQNACDLLLAHRVEKKLQSKRSTDFLNRIQVSQPIKRDEKDRSVTIPASVLKARAAAAEQEMDDDDDEDPSKLFNKNFQIPMKKDWVDPVTGERKKTQREIELEQGGPGVYQFDFKKDYTLANIDWNYDVIPEIMDGKNIADFFDPDIEAQLAQLEAEEEEQMRQYELKGINAMDDDSDMDSEEERQHDLLKNKRALVINEKYLRQTNNKPVLPRTTRARHTTLTAVSDTLGEMGVDAEKMRERSKSLTRGRNPLPQLRSSKHENQATEVLTRGRKRTREEQTPAPAGEDEDMDLDPKERARRKIRERSLSRDHRSAGVAAMPFRDAAQKKAASKLKIVQAERKRNREARMGEGDRHVYDEKPKHLFSGKRGMGKNERR